MIGLDFTVIIPVHNHHEMTYDLILDLDRAARNLWLRNTKKTRLIIVDNGSTIPFSEFCSGREPPSYLQVKVIRNETNRLYSAAMNQGLALVEDEHIVLLNNDTVVNGYFFTDLIRSMERNKCDLVGPVTNKCCGIQQIEECTLSYPDRITGKYRHDPYYFIKRYGAAPEVKWINGFCMCISNKAFKTIGPLDEENYPLSGEEMDYCIRARAAGFTLRVDPFIFVYHYKHVTGDSVDIDTGKAWGRGAGKIREMYPGFNPGDQFIKQEVE